jgi:hypothetical protein
MIAINDIGVVYSGGSTNTNPNLSLGGNPSGYPVLGYMNNLFANISETERANGKIDYRCVYIVNNNSVDTFYDIVATVSYQIPGGSDARIGVQKFTDIQTVTIAPPGPGVYQLSYLATLINVPDQTAASLQAVLNTTIATGAVVTADFSGYILTINFLGADNTRYFSLLSSNTIGVTTNKVQNGGPIVRIADAIPNETTPPGGITFGYNTSSDTSTSATIVGLRHGEFFPIWVQRSTPPGITQQDDDGFTLRLTGNLFSP